MSTFFEKLKKGMEIEELPKPSEKPLKKEKKMKKEKIAKEEPALAKASAGKKEKKFEIKIKEEPEVAKEGTFDVEVKEKKWFQPEGQLTVDVYQTEKELVLQSAIAGIEPRDLDIAIENDAIIIRGKRDKPSEKEERNYFYQECYWGAFSRKIILPTEVDTSKVQAILKKGILTIRIPKIAGEKKRKVAVE